MAKLKKTTNAGEDVEQLVLSYIAEGNAKWENHSGKLAISHKVKRNLPCDPAIPLLSIYFREMKSYVHIKNCT